MSHARQLFQQNFRAIVTPKLRQECIRQGALLALDLTDWTDAEHAVWEIGHKSGSSWLPEEIYHDLLDWIGSTILTEVSAAELKLEEMREQSEAHKAADPIAYYEWLAGGKEILRWHFASQCPVYRAHLMTERESLSARRERCRVERNARKARRETLYVD
jgi:hypothetical protein